MRLDSPDLRAYRTNMGYSVVTPRQKIINAVALVVVWSATAWLLYPLIFRLITPYTAKEYFYRSAVGIILMLIMFGKTVFDLLLPQELTRRKSAVNMILLSVYTIVMAGGIIFMLIRILALYLNKNADTFTGGNVQL
jgi:hypothetical protein